MAKKRGDIKIILDVRDGIGHFTMRHTGPGGRVTLGKATHPMSDKPALRRNISRWICNCHRKMHGPEEASD